MPLKWNLDWKPSQVIQTTLKPGQTKFLADEDDIGAREHHINGKHLLLLRFPSVDFFIAAQLDEQVYHWKWCWADGLPVIEPWHDGKKLQRTDWPLVLEHDETFEDFHAISITWNGLKEKSFFLFFTKSIHVPFDQLVRTKIDLERIAQATWQIHNAPGMPGENEIQPNFRDMTADDILGMLSRIHDAPGMPGSAIGWKEIQYERFKKLLE